MNTKRPVGFLNVDLEIESSRSLEPLVQEMGKAVVVLYSGPGKGRSHFLCLEDARWSNTPDSAALALCAAVERLSARGRRVWEHARRKEFNVGYDLIDGARWVQTTLKRTTLNRIVALGATLAFTCYRGETNKRGAAATGNQPVSPSKKRFSKAVTGRV